MGHIHNEVESYSRDMGLDTYIIYNASNQEEYICSAFPGLATSVTGWSIYKLSYTAAGGVAKRRYANASDDFNKIADNYLTYNYTDI